MHSCNVAANFTAPQQSQRSATRLHSILKAPVQPFIQHRSCNAGAGPSTAAIYRHNSLHQRHGCSNGRRASSCPCSRHDAEQRQQPNLAARSSGSSGIGAAAVAAAAAIAASLPAGAAWAAAAAAVPGPGSETGAFTPGPVHIGWEVYVGAIAGVIPFAIGAYEFGKRILIQRRCETCSGSGLVTRGRFQRKCPDCGGFFPWRGWGEFLGATASPGNGGPLRAPRGQTSVFYKVPPKPQPRQQAGSEAGQEEVGREHKEEH